MDVRDDPELDTMGNSKFGLSPVTQIVNYLDWRVNTQKGQLGFELNRTWSVMVFLSLGVWDVGLDNSKFQTPAFLFLSIDSKLQVLLLQ